MIPRPFALYAGAVALTCLLGIGLHDSGPTPIRPSEAEDHAGQTVEVAGVVANVGAGPNGVSRFEVRSEGWGLPVRLSQGRPPGEGSWVRVAGSLLRVGGVLTLKAESATVTESAAPGVASPGWDELARRPQDWQDRPIQLAGRQTGATFTDGSGHAVAMQAKRGARLPAENVVATGTLAYDDACLCFTFSVTEARPWTP